MRRPARTSRRLWAAATAALLLAGCGGGPGGGGPEADGQSRPGELEGSALVVGSSLDRWSLLTVPRDGGEATARAAEDPTHVLWEGTTTLPPAERVTVLEGPVVLLSTPDGTLHRYDPRSEELAEIGQVGDGARWSARGRYGVIASEEDARVIQVGPDGSWRYDLQGRPRWAAPVEGGSVAVLLGGSDGSSSLWLIRGGDSRPRSQARVSYGPPGVVAAWGKRLAFAGGEGLEFVSVPSLTVSGEAALDGEVGALVASPSSHALYAAVSAPPRVLEVNRFSGSVEPLAELPGGDAVELRAAPLGQFLLAHDGSRAHWIPVSGGVSRPFDAVWRFDLPLGTPGGAVLLARESGLYLWRPEEQENPRPVEAPADHWWTPVRWSPAPPVVTDRIEGREPGRDADRATRGSLAVQPPGDSLPAVPDRPDGAAADTTPAPGRRPSAAPADGEDEGDGEVEPGFYAIAASARERGGVRELLDRLASAGYPTTMQRHEDDAGRVWYRGLVGPYQSRAEAEASARQLRRERDLSVWVTQIRATPTEIVP